MHISSRLLRPSCLIIAITLLVCSQVSIVNAIDTYFYSTNTILYSDPDASQCSDSDSGSTTDVANTSEHAEAILRFFTGKGLTLAQASGFVGNMAAESGLEPAIIQGGGIAPDNYTPVNGVGFGLVQWTFSSRQQPLVAMAKSMGKPVTDMGVQLNYVWKELTTNYKSTLEALTADNSINPVQAAIIVHGKTPATRNDPRFANAPSLGYEASADSADAVVKVRGGKAQAFYNTYKGKIADGTGVSGINTGGSTGDTTSICNAAYSSAGCNVTKPIYGSTGGNGKQLEASDLANIYGGPDPNAIKKNLTNVDFLGHSVQVNKLVAGCLTAVANEIKSKNIDYKINNIGGYRYDSNNGSTNIGTSSYHTYGAAVDINACPDPVTRPCADGNPFSQNGSPMPHTMPQSYIDAFAHHGWSWGGDWHSVKDYMHFEFNGLGPKDIPKA